ncbi:hypothetical protein AB0L63_10530 [Nocardia sp. NPDC051990]|uniref:hypothetical protein n=1 Tax=Nocardia sp. NPDC051990 TaxID=3155285 RepID=UPI0034260C1D
MKTGFVTEVHVVIYCDVCGDTYTENTGEGICFDTVNQAVAYLTSRSAVLGWVYDGDKVVCDGCQALARCTEAGHTFPERRIALQLNKTTRPRTCTVCGISETEALS